MSEETIRVSERSNKGVPPKRLDMDPPGGQNSPSASTSTFSQQQSTTGNKSSQQRPQPDLLRALADMQREMMKQINSVNINLNSLIATQKEQTNASIASLHQEIKRISERVVVSEPIDQTNVNLQVRPTHTHAIEETIENIGESITNHSSHSQGSTSHKAKKLYPLPKFGGLPEEWPTFIEDFKQTTAEFEYSALQNIIRIREALHGPAKETVESLLSSSQNIDIIINSLAETYGRPEQLIRSQIEKIKTLSYVPEGKLDLLVNFSTKVSNMVRFLQTANGKQHLNNPTLLSELISKLPPTKQMQWAERCFALARPVDLVDFGEWLEGVRKIVNIVSDGLPSSSTSAARNNARPLPKNKFVLTSFAKQCMYCAGSCNLLTDCRLFKEASVDERWKKARELRLCFSCLKGHHHVGKCFKKQRCGINNCTKQHHPLLHATDRKNGKQINGVATTTENENPTTVVNLHAGTKSSEILFQIIPVKLYGPKGYVSIFAFIDDGADATMLEWEVGKEIGLEGRPDNLKLQWLNGHCSSQQTEMVDLSISGSQEDNKKYRISKIYLVKNLELPIQSFSSNEVTGMNTLTEVPIVNYHKIRPQMIISLTHAYLTVPVEIPICHNDNGPIAVKTRLGWVVYGPTGVDREHNVKSVYHSRRQEANAAMEQMMKQYFETESCMVKLEAKPVIAKSEETALNTLKSTTKFCGDRYECGLLWKSETRSFPDSYGQSLRRLQLVEKQFCANAKFESEYREKMQHLLNEGYARRLGDEETKHSATTFFLPHFAVCNPPKKGIRLVFDAAAKVNGVSLNDLLLPGPDLNQSLISVLFKFREQPIAVCGDIKEMFMQVAIRREDQDSQRFLYRESATQPVGQYVMTRAIFGATCSPTIAQYVKNINAQRFVNYYPRAAEAVIKRHYVDDYADCFNSVEEALSVVENVIKIHKAGGFQMHKIISNSEEINSHFSGPTVQNINMASGNTQKILGMQWSAGKDEFIFDIELKRVSADILENKRIPTKREVLKVIMSVFDPFGFLCDFTISGKILMQSLWKCGLEWDEEIPEALWGRWNTWTCGLKKVRDFSIPRCYFNKQSNQKRTLHVFCDASEMAMATVAYWKYDSSNGPKLSFVAGKANCAPKKYVSIPRLELQAAVMAVRLKNAIVQNHNIRPDEVCFWTDSSTVVRWLTSAHRRYKQFVANRVAEIMESSDENQWRWVPGDMNPADEATRPSLLYNSNGRWKNGPEFLYRPAALWPSNCTSIEKINTEEELRRDHYVLSTRLLSTTLFDVNRFSKYERLKRHLAWIFRYTKNLKLKAKQLPLQNGGLTAEEEVQAEHLLIQNIQKTAFAEEYACISRGQAVSANSAIVSLNPYIDEYGNLRCGGRIDNAPFISLSTKRPYILPKHDRVTRLLVQWYHERQNHINDRIVICEIRLKYWIPSIRVVLNTVKAACCVCKVRKSKPIQPIMGPLPEDRLCAFVRPFSYTGLDYFGPVMVTVRRSQEKRWIALFTCLTTRAVHLEVATDLSSDSCLLCIRNFVNRRGVPVQIRSDNGTNFVGIEKELDKEDKFIDFGTIEDGLRPLGIRWRFNTPADPSAGGAWERLVQSVKRAMYAALREQTLRPETLNSLLIESENIVNSRPLTHLPVSPQDPEPLTPNHFLLGCPNSTQTPAPFNPKLCHLRKQWRILQNLKNCLWRRWMLEYLPELTRRTKWCRPSKPITTGALVLICETTQARSQWKRGRIHKLFVGKDGVARSAEVNTASGILRRPVSKLALLDVESCREVDSMGSIHGVGDVGNTA